MTLAAGDLGDQRIATDMGIYAVGAVFILIHHSAGHDDPKRAGQRNRAQIARGLTDQPLQVAGSFSAKSGVRSWRGVSAADTMMIRGSDGGGVQADSNTTTLAAKIEKHTLILSHPPLNFPDIWHSFGRNDTQKGSTHAHPCRRGLEGRTTADRDGG